MKVVLCLGVVIALLGGSVAMLLDPERVAARLRIEAEAEQDKLLRTGRNRRQLSQPKEVTIQVTAPLFSSRLFEYGDEAGDQELPVSLDSTKKLQLSKPISFYGKQYQTVYIGSNGAITFDTAIRTHRSNILPSNYVMIAPFWNRNKLENGGHVYYREITSGRVLERGQSEIRYQYDKSVKVISCLLVTWEKMQPLGANPLPDENTNTFQAALFVTDNGTYANFIYNNIGWTQGAEAGFNGGQDSLFYALPTSGTGNIMYLEEYGNTGIPGEWMFELGEKRIIRCKAGLKGDTCDEECSPGEWGIDCIGCCHCSGNTTCNKVNGECPNNQCSECFSGSQCQTKLSKCSMDSPRKCARNGISLTDYDRCGEPLQRCQCLDGYEGDGYARCNDIDECKKNNVCHQDAVCTNTPGHFFCQCKPGYSGDGVMECMASDSFLFPTNGENLPPSQNSKVTIQLQKPVKLFGLDTSQLTISSNGLITVDDSVNILPGDSLDDMNVVGIAPFFAPIDLSKGGDVRVKESAEDGVLARATHIVNDNGESGGFIADNVIIISFINVSTPSTQTTNTYQTVVISGRDSKKQPSTFVEFLYKDLTWTPNAEAGIMTSDKSNSIQLPGSGTEGMEQLSQLSNVRQPGVWLYRVDRDVIHQCMKSDLQPPYCDAESPPLIKKTQSNEIPEVKQTTPQVKIPTESVPTEIDDDQFEIPEVASTSIVPPSEPSTQRVPAVFATAETRRPQISLHVQNTPELERPSTLPIPTISTTHRPIVQLNSKEIEALPPDVFENPLPPFVTVVPELFTAKSKPNEEPTQIGKVHVIQPELIRPSIIGSFNTNPPAVVTSVEEVTHEFINNDFPQAPIETTVVEDEAPTSTPTTPESTTTATTQSTTTATETTTVISEQSPSSKNVIKIQTETMPTTNNNLFVFTSTKSPPKKILSSKPKIVTGSPHKENEEMDNSIEQGRVLEAEMAGSRLAVVIPVTIVAVWVVILIVIAFVLCCQRRRTHHTLRTVYGPPYHIRPVGTYTLRGDPSLKHYEGIYEENIEKSRGFPADLGPYQTGGRMSLYGSYWNLSNASRSGIDRLHPMS
ncbi:unnamed protein product [Bursaphelenchus xylophilus]|uniref:(pine wood nematode) hypothetical protein n=1 Tax=Bursaphelenchus xylophilus TaxID=6326 RepID=A0A1I7STC7_BURXY|nr:unnamed protein product [Bursaphelenchus xylophilus]CAG9108566.1 unnamed protein product [Bursaphelenchus xylophilus]